jgi:hypothetical protein
MLSDELHFQRSRGSAASRIRDAQTPEISPQSRIRSREPETRKPLKRAADAALGVRFAAAGAVSGIELSLV